MIIESKMGYRINEFMFVIYSFIVQGWISVKGGICKTHKSKYVLGFTATGIASQSPMRYSLGICMNNKDIHRWKLFQNKKHVSKLTAHQQVGFCSAGRRTCPCWECSGSGSSLMDQQLLPYTEIAVGPEHRMALAPSAVLVQWSNHPIRTECTTYKWMHTSR